MAEELDSILRRMDTLERNQSDHSRKFTEFTLAGEAMDKRVKVLEQIQQDRRVSDVERTAREQSMQKDIKSIESRMEKIETGVGRILWAIAGAVILAVVGFVLRGGLNG